MIWMPDSSTPMVTPTSSKMENTGGSMTEVLKWMKVLQGILDRPANGGSAAAKIFD